VLHIDGDRRSDVLWYGPGSVRDAYATAAHGFGRLFGTTVNGVYEPVVGNFDGDAGHYDDVLWRRAGSAGDDAYWTGSASGFVSLGDANAHSDARSVRAVVGEFNGGDRAADVLLYDDAGNASMLYGYNPTGTP
jgi:hypothetical protein